MAAIDGSERTVWVIVRRDYFMSQGKGPTMTDTEATRAWEILWNNTAPSDRVWPESFNPGVWVELRNTAYLTDWQVQSESQR